MSNKRRVSKNLGKRKKKDCLLATVTATKNDIVFAIDFSNGTIAFPDAKVESLHHRVFYDRKSGKDKVVSEVPCEENKGYLDHIKSLRTNVDFLFAVDTNTVEVSGERTSFSVSYAVPYPLSRYRTAIPFDPFVAFDINAVRSDVNPERVGWHLLLQGIVGNPVCGQQARVGIIVDSEFGLLTRINRREMPYYNEHYLPSNVQLIYASTDTGRDYLANQMILYCDRMASKTAEYFRNNKIKLNTRANGDNLFRGYRRLCPKASSP